jgi:hypothetical protein
LSLLQKVAVRALVLLTILVFADASQGRRSVEILDTGSFHGDEVPADASGRWFALVREGNGASLRGHLYQLSLRCTETVVEGQRQEQCDPNLRSGRREQLRFTYGSYFANGQRIWASEDTPEVHWAGDIDGDGRLDVLLDTTDHYNVREMPLYLSSAAKHRALVGEAAPFTATGC